GPHPELGDPGAVERLEGHCVVLAGDLLGARRQVLGRRDVTRGVLQVTGAVLGRGTHARLLHDPARVHVGSDLERLERALVVVAGIALVLVEAVEAEQRPLHQRGGNALAVRLGPGQRAGAEVAGALGGYRRGHARLLGVELFAFPEPDHDQPAPAVLVRHGDALQLPLRLARLDECGDGSFGRRGVLEQTDHARVRRRLLSRPLPGAYRDRRHPAATLASARRPISFPVLSANQETIDFMPKTAILASARAPFGKLGGALAPLDATELGGKAIEAALE